MSSLPRSPSFGPDGRSAAVTGVRSGIALTRAAAQAVAQELASASRSDPIIRICNQMGHVGGIDRHVRCASKHAPRDMTRSMAVGWDAPGIRVKTPCPSFIRTPLSEATVRTPERPAWIKGRTRLGRAGEVGHIMGAEVCPASDASALGTRSELKVDGNGTAG